MGGSQGVRLFVSVFSAEECSDDQRLRAASILHDVTKDKVAFLHALSLQTAQWSSQGRRVTEISSELKVTLGRNKQALADKSSKLKVNRRNSYIGISQELPTELKGAFGTSQASIFPSSSPITSLAPEEGGGMVSSPLTDIDRLASSFGGN